ncbi:hypothetical protein R1flu_027317 [Riccia fluitans]|uniref:Uncharacterized protein n=1 Tax=Riccia fluitans TaxID=41844 RepID=A0ABD1XJ14_9MARC
MDPEKLAPWAMSHDKTLTQVLREDVQRWGMVVQKQANIDIMTFLWQSLARYTKRIHQGHAGTTAEGTSAPRLGNVEVGIAGAFLIDIRRNYDWKADV